MLLVFLSSSLRLQHEFPNASPQLKIHVGGKKHQAVTFDGFWHLEEKDAMQTAIIYVNNLNQTRWGWIVGELAQDA